ncbi:hypothetical protein IWQ60_007446 [Tieghemiomyces parasiticus]|uniref:Fanconi-associated nuclease n=1 Tax=Tieghemiomyces parasiticus TaxID=78921 RepID=A0A9W7ZXI7_9FUNG|nr:hypothetical protein IWQ60_007446 [Tieghemiomyces parasiticus]
MTLPTVIDLTDDGSEEVEVVSPPRCLGPSLQKRSDTPLRAPPPGAPQNSEAREPPRTPEVPAAPPALKQYYLESFRGDLETVLAGEAHLLSEEELTLCAVFHSLSTAAQYLTVRLLARKPGWLRLAALNYPEVGPLEPILDELLSADIPLLDCGDRTLTDLTDLLNLLTLEELRRICKPVDPRAAKSKPALIAQYLKIGRSQRTLSFDRPAVGDRATMATDTIPPSSPWYRRAARVLGRVVRLTPAVTETFQRVQFIYHRGLEPADGNAMTTTVMSTIGRWNYPRYVVTRSLDLFPDRSALLAYESAVRLRHDLGVLTDSGRTDPAFLHQAWALCIPVRTAWRDCIAAETATVGTDPGGHYRRRYTVGYVYTRILGRSTRVLETLKDYATEAELLRDLLDQRIYSLRQRGRWYERLALIQTNYGIAKDAPAAAKEISWRLVRATCLEALEDPYVQDAEKRLLVKRLARMEKRLGLAPSDVYCSALPERREAPIVTITGIRAGSSRNRPVYESAEGSPCVVESLVLQHYETQGYRGVWQEEQPRATRCVGIHWSYELSDLLEIAEALGGQQLVGICRHLAQNYKAHRSGLPDLCLWNAKRNHFKAVEVKGPGDTLSETQKTWIDVLLMHGVDVELCRVVATDGPVNVDPEGSGNNEVTMPIE